MTFKRFNRQLFAKTESTEGTVETIAAANFVECLDDVAYTLSPQNFERNLVRPAHTHIPMFFASTGITSSDFLPTSVEITATVELTQHNTNVGGSAFTVNQGYGDLLKACGMEKFETVKVETISVGPTAGAGPTVPQFYHREEFTSIVTDSRVVGSTFIGDTELYYTGTDPDAVTITGNVSTTTATITNGATAAGHAYAMSTDAGAGDGSSCTMELFIDGRELTVKGCRGNCEMAFVSTDRVLMTFTMTGILHNAVNASATEAIDYNHKLPPTWIATDMQLMEATGTTNFTSMFFSAMTLSFGNEVVLREDANSANGWKAAQITDSLPTLTFNPDAIVGGATSASVFDFWDKFAQGTVCRATWDIGTKFGGNHFAFLTPGLQFTGIADGDRDNFTIYECTANLTGGLSGDSVNAAGDAQLYADKGANNEITIIMT